MTKIGSIGWLDLTVDKAEDVKEFYSKVIGWQSNPVSQGDYNDFTMHSPADNSVQVGICHARGGNADIPPVWMVYFHVENIDDSLAMLAEHGGQQKGEIKNMGADRYVLIQDPAGAHCMLYEKNS